MFYTYCHISPKYLSKSRLNEVPCTKCKFLRIIHGYSGALFYTYCHISPKYLLCSSIVQVPYMGVKVDENNTERDVLSSPPKLKPLSENFSTNYQGRPEGVMAVQIEETIPSWHGNNTGETTTQSK